MADTDCLSICSSCFTLVSVPLLPEILASVPQLSTYSQYGPHCLDFNMCIILNSVATMMISLFLLSSKH